MLYILVRLYMYNKGVIIFYKNEQLKLFYQNEETWIVAINVDSTSNNLYILLSINNLYEFPLIKIIYMNQYFIGIGNYTPSDPIYKKELGQQKLMYLD